MRAPGARPDTIEQVTDSATTTGDQTGPPSQAGSPSDDTWGAFRQPGPWVTQRQSAYTADDATRRQHAKQLAASWSSGKGLPVGNLARLVGVAGREVGRFALRNRQAPRAERAATGFRRGAETLGASWVKLGQIISAGDGVFPDALVAQCRQLTDRAAPVAFERLEDVLRAELGPDWRREFATFDETPIAAASIAQTHRAQLHDGTWVAVKIQRPGIDTKVARDITALAKVAPLLVGRIPVAALANPPALVELFAETIVEELDFRLEAANLLDAAEAIARWGQGNVVVPRPHPTLVTRRVLVMEYLDGHQLRTLSDLGAELTEPQRRAVIETLLETVLEGALLAGVFHGDLHQGNMTVLKDGTVGLFDFGITARLTTRERAAFANLVANGLGGNWEQQLRALAELGALPHDADFAQLGRDLGLDTGPIDPTRMSGDELNAELQRLSKTLLASGAKLPKPLMLWAKNIAFLDTAIGQIAPDIDLIDVVTAAVTTFITRHANELFALAGNQVTIDREALKTGLGIPTDVDAITWREMRERRELIAKRARPARMRREP